jgi:hypothetical protein
LRRKLILMNLALIAVIALAGWRLRTEWLEARAREDAVLQKRIKPVAAPKVSPLPKVEPVKPAGYIDIAQKMLFSKDRNPTVVVEAPAPPPPKPMPPLPIFHGVYDLGEGVTAVMSEKPAAPHRDYRPGDQVGDFKLVSVDTQQIVLEWDGKKIVKQVQELVATAAAAQPAAANQGSAAAPPPKVPVHADAAPGPDLGRGVSACQRGDDSPEGTVANGMRKVIKKTPFGGSCYWEPLK